MLDENGVEIVVPAPDNNNGTETPTPVVPTDETEKKLNELNEVVNTLVTDLTKSQSDTENYKNGMLKYKQKLKEAGYDDEDEDDDKISKAVAKALEPIMQQLKPKEDNAVTQAQTKIAELTLALKNRAQISNTPAGSGTGEQPAVKDQFFSEAQLADLKKRGLDPDKVKANLLKYKDRA